MKVRRPYVAGAFYSGSKSALTTEIERCFTHKFGPGKIPERPKRGERKLVALVCPHAGYMYSGPVAANSYYHLAVDGLPPSIVIIGPNHSGMGSGVSAVTEGIWLTPLGEVTIDTETAKRICAQSSIVDIEERSHTYEHSIEVQLPFLQYIFGDNFRFVPICMMMQDLETSKELGEALATALKGLDAVIIASSDMTHYEPHEIAEKRDKLAIDAILEMDDLKLQKVIESQNITMCGHGPVAAAIRAAKELGATKANLLGYKTSGDITGDKSSVVGYLSVSMQR